MKIAIAAPSPVPFTIGGAENLYWGLLHTINQTTPHQAELIKLPSPESDFRSLLDSYRTFSELDLSHFDMVISTKYPSWMAFHENHVCYMLHKLRGLYDAYPYEEAPYSNNAGLLPVDALQRFMRVHRGNRDSLPEFFDRVGELSRDRSIPDEAFAFPGPFIREIVHFLDGIGLSSRYIVKYAAIANNVAARKYYFPENARVDVIYPPSILKGFQSGRYDYFFTVSRLDGPKRVRLFIEAMRQVKSPVKLLIAGSGPDEASLKELAGDDPRIRFLGFINDKELVDLYSNALAVLFAPYDEDYGLITIEAMMSEKPVITTVDAGGPNEFVVDGENGFSVEPAPHALAEKMEYLFQHKHICEQMGRRAGTRVAPITWANAAARLLDAGSERGAPPRRERKEKLTVVTTFPVHPPRGGGQNRVHHLYRHLARWFDVELVTLTNPGETEFDGIIAPGVREIRVPKSAGHAKQEFSRYESRVDAPVVDVAFPSLHHLTPDFLEALKRSSADADVVVASHPYTHPAIREVYDGPIWYEAHNVEIELKKSILPDNPAGARLLEATREVESACCRECELLMVCCREDGETLHKLYGADPAKVIEVPNGVDLSSVTYHSLERRAALKARLGLEAHFLAFFMGSWHGPNLEAMEWIVHLAGQSPRITFLMLGSGCSYIENQPLPPNIRCLGVVDDETKDVVLGAVDVALNPMAAGSGTNLKVLDYMAAGVPVISTSFGARGLRARHGKEIVIAGRDRFGEAMDEIRREETGVKAGRILAARRHVEKEFDWTVIARRFAREAARRRGA